MEVTDFVEAPGAAYLVMELLEGKSLRDLTAARGEGYPSIARLVALLGQVSDALHAAHEKGVIHRDLKPDNVFVVERDGREFAKVLDFGVAKLADPADHAATTAGMILGTPHYMAPEQALGREVDRRTDVWAAGVVLHELLAGAVPFKARSFVELAMAIRERPPAPLPESTPGGERIPADLAAVVARCLEKRPADRYATMAELAEALRGRRAAARAPRSGAGASSPRPRRARARGRGGGGAVARAAAAARGRGRAGLERAAAACRRRDDLDAGPARPCAEGGGALPRALDAPRAEGGAGARRAPRAQADGRALAALDPARRAGGPPRHRPAARHDAGAGERPPEGGVDLDRDDGPRVPPGEVPGRPAARHDGQRRVRARVAPDEPAALTHPPRAAAVRARGRRSAGRR